MNAKWLMAIALLGATGGEVAAQKPEKNIVGVAVEAGTFNTLVAAVKAAGLVDVLSGPGPFTVFAPTDEAFAKLPKGTVEALLKDPKKLASILTYHVLPAKVMAADVVKGGNRSVATVNGQSLMVRVANGGVQVDGAKVIATDVLATNGVIHVIDTVVLPKAASKPGSDR